MPGAAFATELEGSAASRPFPWPSGTRHTGVARGGWLQIRVGDDIVGAHDIVEKVSDPGSTEMELRRPSSRVRVRMYERWSLASVAVAHTGRRAPMDVVGVGLELQGWPARQRLTVAVAAAEVLMPQYADFVHERHGESNALRPMLDRLWSLALELDEADVWDDADRSFDLAAEVETTAQSGQPGAKAAAMAVHYAVRSWLVQDGQQAALAMNEAVTYGPQGTHERLRQVMLSLESGGAPQEFYSGVPRTC
jgi:hypothetical protein